MNYKVCVWIPLILLKTELLKIMQFCLNAMNPIIDQVRSNILKSLSNSISPCRLASRKCQESYNKKKSTKRDMQVAS